MSRSCFLFSDESADRVHFYAANLADAIMSAAQYWYWPDMRIMTVTECAEDGTPNGRSVTLYTAFDGDTDTSPCLRLEDGHHWDYVRHNKNDFDRVCLQCGTTCHIRPEMESGRLIVSIRRPKPKKISLYDIRTSAQIPVTITPEQILAALQQLGFSAKLEGDSILTDYRIGWLFLDILRHRLSGQGNSPSDHRT